MNRPLIIAVALLSATIIPAYSQYTGTGSVTQGRATPMFNQIYSCPKGRPTNLGGITSTDGKQWIVPASVQFSDSTFPRSSDLHNACTGVTYANTAAAVAALKGSEIVTVDADGEMITAFLFADNYFEMYVNGKPVGKDNVPYTQFNSSIVRFRAKRPCTIAMLGVDWEENLGLGTEAQGPAPYHAGDAGVVVTFVDANGTIVGTTSSAWKAQTYYISPVQDLACLSEQGNVRSSKQCSTADAADGSMQYGVHWLRPEGWMNSNFDDSAWPNAVVFSNQEVGVDNKPAYTNFTDVFDASGHDAQFIWTSNLVLDNEVLLRYTLPGATSIDNNTIDDHAMIRRSDNESLTVMNTEMNTLTAGLYTAQGALVTSHTSMQDVTFATDGLSAGLYMIVIHHDQDIRTIPVVIW